MTLSIVVSKAGAKESRISTDTGLKDVLDFFKLLGVADWNLLDKGAVALEFNGSVLFIAVGPLNRVDKKAFLAQAVACLRQAK